MADRAEYVEGVTASLVREYLSRKGLQQTLTTMDEELPRMEDSISNRTQLMRILHMEKMMKKNKEQEQPLKAMLELMTKYFLEKPVSVRHTAAPLGLPAADQPHIHQATAVVSPLINSSGQSDNNSPSSQALRIHKGSTRRTSDLILEDSLEGETILGDGRVGQRGSSLQDKPLSISGIIPRPRSSRQPRMMGNVMSNVDEIRRPGLRGKMSKPGTYYTDNTEKQTNYNKPSFLQKNDADSHTTDEMSYTADCLTSPPGSHTSHNSLAANKQEGLSFEDILAQDGHRKPGRRKASEDLDSELSYNVKESSISGDQPPTRTAPSRKAGASHNRNEHQGKPKKKDLVRVGDVEFGDVDDLDSDLGELHISAPLKPRQTISSVNATNIDLKTAMDLKKLIFGSANQNFNDEWKYQAFTFCDIPGLKYGIVQKKGGSCGVLAAVQATILQLLLYSTGSKPTVKSLSPSRLERTQALAEALSLIFWRAGDKRQAVVALSCGRSLFTCGGRFKGDNLTETLVLNRFDKQADLDIFLQQNVSQFELDGCSGVILALYSVILSRGIERVTSDMDEPTNKLMGAHGYCTQDMVNLFLTGAASSNVFNDTMELDSGQGQVTVLKGIQGRSDIGLLSLFEHYKSCQVGTYYKTPRYPIWVICSESHFSVLFSIKRDLISDWKAERRFDLYYYDGLAKQEQEIKLTVDTTNKFFQPPADDELVPPLELCIRTKWPGAEIDWNGTDPLL